MPLKRPTIEGIVNLFTRRKTKADVFWRLAEPHVKFLYNLALGYCGNRCEAEDLVQETFFIAFKQYDQLRDERKLKSWMCAILRNTYIGNRRRRNGRAIEIEYEDGVDYIVALENSARGLDAAELHERKAESQLIQAALAEMPEKYKSPLLLYYMADMSYRQIAETLELPIGTVMSRLSRGKGILKKKLLHFHR